MCSDDVCCPCQFTDLRALRVKPCLEKRAKRENWTVFGIEGIDPCVNNSAVTESWIVFGTEKGSEAELQNNSVVLLAVNLNSSHYFM